MGVFGKMPNRSPLGEPLITLGGTQIQQRGPRIQLRGPQSQLGSPGGWTENEKKMEKKMWWRHRPSFLTGPMPKNYIHS